MQHIDAVIRRNNSISAKPAMLAGSICAASLPVATSLPVTLTSRPQHHRWFIDGNDYGYMSDEATVVLNKESRPRPPLRT
jgi:hypothetical protein